MEPLKDGKPTNTQKNILLIWKSYDLGNEYR